MADSTAWIDLAGSRSVYYRGDQLKGRFSVIFVRGHARRWATYAGSIMALALIVADAHGAPELAASSHSAAGQSQHGHATPVRPPPVQVVQIEPSPEAVAQAAEAEAAKRRFLGLEPDAWVAVFTLGLALFTAGLVAATISLWRATKRLSDSTEKLAAGAEDQVNEMRQARDLAERQHELAEKQFSLACRQCDLADKQHGLQRLQFMAEHRPIINIRGIGISREKGDFPIEAAKPIMGSLVIWNGGACDAYILEASYRFFITQHDLPMVPPLDSDKVKALIGSDLPHKLIGHGSHLVPIQNAALGERAKGILGGVEKLYVIGAIRYHGGDIDMADGTMRERWMGFCRKYVTPEIAGGDGRFIPVDNTDYEYSD